VTLKIIRNVLNYLTINLCHNRKSYSSTPESEIKAVMLELMKALKTFDPYNYDTLNIQDKSNGKKKTLLSHEVLLFFIASTIYSLF